MTLDEIQQQLAALTACGDSAFAQAAQQIAEMTQSAQAGAMSTQDLAEILKDMQRQLEIVEDASQIALKEALNTCINGIIKLIGVVG
jgi:uncharacterized FlaG/YvyC family protein